MHSFIARVAVGVRCPRHPYAGVHPTGGAVAVVVVQGVVGAVDEDGAAGADVAHRFDVGVRGSGFVDPRQIPTGAARGGIVGRAIAELEPLTRPKVR